MAASLLEVRPGFLWARMKECVMPDCVSAGGIALNFRFGSCRSITIPAWRFGQMNDVKASRKGLDPSVLRSRFRPESPHAKCSVAAMRAEICALGISRHCTGLKPGMCGDQAEVDRVSAATHCLLQRCQQQDNTASRIKEGPFHKLSIRYYSVVAREWGQRCLTAVPGGKPGKKRVSRWRLAVMSHPERGFQLGDNPLEMWVASVDPEPLVRGGSVRTTNSERGQRALELGRFRAEFGALLGRWDREHSENFELGPSSDQSGFSKEVVGLGKSLPVFRWEIELRFLAPRTKGLQESPVGGSEVGSAEGVR